GMATPSTTIGRESVRRARRIRLQVGDDIRRARLDNAVSMARLAATVGIDRSHLSRIEAGTARPTLEVLTGIGVALGADISVRLFAGVGPRLHDHVQAAMTEAFLRALHPRWRVALEVPVSDPVRGVIDIVLSDRTSTTTVACEVQSDLRRLEQQIRWSAE